MRVQFIRAKRYARRQSSGNRDVNLLQYNDPRVRRPLESSLHTPSNSIRDILVMAVFRDGLCVARALSMALLYIIPSRWQGAIALADLDGI